MKTEKDAKPKGTILIADYDFGDVNIERAIIEGAGFKIVAAQCKSEDEVIEHGRDADGVLAQYAPIGARAINAFTRCRVIARYGTGVDIVDLDVAAYRSRTLRTNGAPRRLPTTPSPSGSRLPARSASTIGQFGVASGAGRRGIRFGVSAGAFSASYPSAQSHATSRNA
jgi:hypothetical protein